MLSRLRFRRLLRWALILLALALIALYLALPLVYGFYATRSARAAVGAPPSGFGAVSLTTDDGVPLAAWYAPPQNGAAIVLVHGSGDSRDDVRAHAEMLARSGFGVLALDLRGHGESGGDANRLGWQGSSDVGAAVRYLQSRGEVRAIGGLGLSVGGEILLGAASEYPALRALVSEGATYRSLDEFKALPEHRGFINSLQIRMLSLAVMLFGGGRPPTPILDSIMAAHDMRLLLIAAGNESQEIAYNEAFAEAVATRAEVWVVPGAGHTQGLSRSPEEYERRVIGFLMETLLDAHGD